MKPHEASRKEEPVIPRCKSLYDIITFPVYGDYLVHVEIASNIAAALKKYPQTRCVEDITDAMAVHVSNEPMTFIFLKPNANTGTIAHECWHAVKRMLQYVDVDLDNETVAYHLGYLVRKVFDFVRKGTRDRARKKGQGSRPSLHKAIRRQSGVGKGSANKAGKRVRVLRQASKNKKSGRRP